MNLLNDKREQELSVDNANLQDALFESLNQEHHETAEPPKAGTVHKKKSFLGPLMAVVLVFAAAIVIVYYGFYKKNFELPSFAKQESSESMTREKPTEAEDGQKVETANAKPDQTAEVGDKKSCIQLAPDIMNSISGVLGPDISISALFFDEGSFSAELRAPSTAEAASIYQTLENNLNSSITLTSTAPRTGQNALVAGTFSSRPASGGSTMSSVQLEEALRELADDSGALVSSINISSASQGQTVFLKLDGSFDVSRQFLQRLAQLNLNITVSKLLLMPGQNGNYAFVLRFYL